MSRKTLYQDKRLTVVGGDDHALGKFLQLFDKEMENETPEGEGVIYEWSEFFGVETNYTGIPGSTPPQMLIDIYVKEHSEK